MERFPLELNVVWDNYNEVTYNKLLETRFGEGNIDPIIPFLLQEYAKNQITISPRIALDAYQIYEECGPESLHFIAEFAKKPALIADALKKFQATVQFKQIGSDIEDMINALNENTRRTPAKKKQYVEDYNKLVKKHQEVRKLVVGDDMAQTHSALSKKVAEYIDSMKTKYQSALASEATDSSEEGGEE